MNTRSIAKRRFEEAVTNLDWSLHHLKWVSETYQTVPDVKEPTDKIIAIIIACEEGLQSIKESF